MQWRVLLGVGWLVVGCDGGESDADYGYLRIRVEQADAAAGAAIARTTQVAAVAGYTTCTSDFYATHPDQQQGGDNGGLQFEYWEARLCAIEHPRLADCSVSAIEQDLDVAQTLRVAYEVSSLESGQELAFGPIPHSAMTSCSDSVPLGFAQPVLGFGPLGDILWEATSMQPLDDDGPVLVIQAAVVD